MEWLRRLPGSNPETTLISVLVHHSLDWDKAAKVVYHFLTTVKISETNLAKTVELMFD